MSALSCYRNYDWLCRLDDVLSLGVKYAVIAAVAFLVYRFAKRI